MNNLKLRVHDAKRRLTEECRLLECYAVRLL
jgi:hypothetical protein